MCTFAGTTVICQRRIIYERFLFTLPTLKVSLMLRASSTRSDTTAVENNSLTDVLVFHQIFVAFVVSWNVKFFCEIFRTAETSRSNSHDLMITRRKGRKCICKIKRNHASRCDAPTKRCHFDNFLFRVDNRIIRNKSHVSVSLAIRLDTDDDERLFIYEAAYQFSFSDRTANFYHNKL